MIVLPLCVLYFNAAEQVDKGWMFKDVLKFVMQQPEVVKGYKDGKYYLPSEFLDDDEL